MKKLLAMLLCICMCAMMTGCGEDTKWIDESAAKIDTELTSGQFVLDGVVYEFPMTMQDWLGNGWHISNNYENKDEFALDPWYTSDEFELFNEDGDWVRVSAYNDSDTATKIDQCMIYSVYMSLSEVDVVFPSGMTKRNNPDEILEKYGEPDAKGDEEEALEAYYYFEQDDEWKCVVELDVFDNDYTENPFSSVKYQLMFLDDFWNAWVETEGVEKAIANYLDADLKAGYWGDFTEYTDCCMGTTEEAQEWNDYEAYVYGEYLMMYSDIDSYYMDEATIAKFEDIAKEVLKKTKWEVKNVNVDRFNEGTATVVLYPTNFFSLIDDGIGKAIEAWETKYATTDFTSMSDEEYAVTELDYANMVLNNIDGLAAQAGTGTPIELVCELDLDGAIFTDEDWVNIYDALLDVYSEE